MQRLGEVLDFFPMPRSTQQKRDNHVIRYRFISEYSQERLNLKIEINCREHFHVLDLNRIPLEVRSNWFSGAAAIVTYQVNELLGTKLRALYQRKKGRDLFDLYYTNQQLVLDYDAIIQCYDQYISHSVDHPPTKKQFLQNLEEKVADADFEGDLEGILRAGVTYNQQEAFQWIKNQILPKLG